jgi:hypothetical protein
MVPNWMMQPACSARRTLQFKIKSLLYANRADEHYNYAD